MSLQHSAYLAATQRFPGISATQPLNYSATPQGKSGNVRTHSHPMAFPSEQGFCCPRHVLELCTYFHSQVPIISSLIFRVGRRTPGSPSSTTSSSSSVGVPSRSSSNRQITASLRAFSVYATSMPHVSACRTTWRGPANSLIRRRS